MIIGGPKRSSKVKETPTLEWKVRGQDHYLMMSGEPMVVLFRCNGQWRAGFWTGESERYYEYVPAKTLAVAKLKALYRLRVQLKKRVERYETVYKELETAVKNEDRQLKN